MKYKGYEYEVKFCNPDEDWREHCGMFRIDCAIKDRGYYPTYAEAIEKAKQNIDSFIKSIPKTKKEWIKALNDCLVWTGYEDCEIDEEMAWAVLNKAASFLKTTNADRKGL